MDWSLGPFQSVQIHANRNHEHKYNCYQNGIALFDNSSISFCHSSSECERPYQPNEQTFISRLSKNTFFVFAAQHLTLQLIQNWRNISFLMLKEFLIFTKVTNKKLLRTIFTCFSRLAIWSFSAFLYGLLKTSPVLFVPFNKIDEALGRSVFFVSLEKKKQQINRIYHMKWIQSNVKDVKMGKIIVQYSDLDRSVELLLSPSSFESFSESEAERKKFFTSLLWKLVVCMVFSSSDESPLDP